VDLTARRPAASEAQRAYNALFPYYAEVCALTQLHRKGAKPGGWGGHATLFLNGAAVDRAAGYPRLTLAPEGADLAASDSGVGISVNRIFTNVNWVAIPGRDEFFRGRLAPDESLDERRYEATIARAAGAGWFDGIAIDAALARQRPRTMSLTEFIVRHSIATDFALTFARSVYCARLPLTRELQSRVVDHLNAVNERARSAGYAWNPYTNNCSHVVHNALATTGVWDPKEARGAGALNLARDVLSVGKCVALGRMSDFSFPANTFVRVYEAGNERPIDDAARAFHQHDVVRTLAQGWISTAPGALIASYPMHDAERNELFTAGRDPFLFSLPVLWDKQDTFLLLTRRPPASVIDLGVNLAHFQERYGTILERRHAQAPTGAAASDPRFGAFADRFYDYIAAQLGRTEAMLEAVKPTAV
jgi:hypothetical protein